MYSKTYILFIQGPNGHTIKNTHKGPHAHTLEAEPVVVDQSWMMKVLKFEFQMKKKRTLRSGLFGIGKHITDDDLKIESSWSASVEKCTQAYFKVILNIQYNQLLHIFHFRECILIVVKLISVLE